jgi:serine/threonine protein kinase
MSKIFKIQFQTGDRLGNYVILEKVEELATHIYYRAVEPALDRHVYLTIFKGPYSQDPKCLGRFKEYAAKMVELHHKHIRQSETIAQEQEFYYHAAIYIRGYTLQDWLNEGRTFDEERALWFMTQAVAAFQYAAQFQVYDLALTPISFVVDWDNIVIAINLGIAQCHNLLTGIEQYDCLANPSYVAPEQISGQPVDLRTDMYSLGALIFHLMTGHLPFNASTADAICRAHLQTPFPAEKAMDAGVPYPWVELMGRLMEKDPNDRFQNYQELSEALIKLA